MLSPKYSFFPLLLSSIFGGTITLIGYKLFFEPAPTSNTVVQPARFSKYLEKFTPTKLPEGLNFVVAAEKVTPAVVHIKTYGDNSISFKNKELDEVFDWFKYKSNEENDNEPTESPNHNKLSSGSGVIFSKQGYIVTNHHVIEEAEKIEVILDDKRTFSAKLIGKDEATDLAVIKIEATDLIAIALGNSDQVKIGEWVLAIGNPFDLTSTVTAGIVSAKSRNINILHTQNVPSVEAFIQTDAAVNPGNSGGALVNLKGELIGINTAIATNTGTYSGYSFAVPVDLVQKIANDLIKYGEVQRALLGVNIKEVNAELAEKLNLTQIRGIFVAGISKGSSAEEAGIKIGDVITAINQKSVNTIAELQETIARHNPNDKITLTFERNQQEQTIEVILKDRNNFLEKE